MTAVITLTTAGLNVGPFDIYSNIDGFTIPFETNVSKNILLSGFTSSNVPDDTTIIRVVSLNNCTNYYDIVVPPQTCYRYIPTNGSFIFSSVYKENSTYTYGYFTDYEESGLLTSYKNLVKLNPDLTLDTSFNVGTGFNEILYSGSSIIEQSDGKIIATGTFTSYQGLSANRIIRLNTDGSRDTTFNIGSGFSNFTQKPSIDLLDRIIVTGIFSSYNGIARNCIIRLLPNGNVDTSFVIGTGFNNTTLSAIVNEDNSLIITGYFNSYNGVPCGNGITKLNSIGTIDTSFNVGSGFNPYVTNNPTYLTRIEGETSFYAVGYFTSYKGVSENRIIKIDRFGNKDVSFNSGSGFNESVSNIEVVWGDKLFITGSFSSYNGVTAYGVIVLNKDGSIYYTPGANYQHTPIIIGNNLFGRLDGGCFDLLFTKS